jgi:TonB family protein
MKVLKLSLLYLVSGLMVLAVDYSRPIRGALAEIRKDVSPNGLPQLRGHSPGYPGSYGAFILYFPKIYGNATRADVELMLKDVNPVIRLIGARIAMNYGMPYSLYMGLEQDTSRLWVGPFLHAAERFREMTVAEVYAEMRHDPLFQLRAHEEGSVHLDFLNETGKQVRSTIVLGSLPDYPAELANAGITGTVLVRITFVTDSAKPKIEILKSSQPEFNEATIWAISKWELKAASPSIEASAPRAFECRISFKLADDD